MPKITITKLDVVFRQLRAAIGMYFHDEDPVPIHTLASAAYDILMHINRKKGNAPMEVKETILDKINPKYRDKIRRMMWEPQNFFKHADKDPEGVLEFNTLLTEMFLFECVEKYHDLTGELRVLPMLFSLWFLLNNPEMVTQNEFLDNLKQEIQSQNLMDDKKKFFNVVGSILIDKGLK